MKSATLPSFWSTYGRLSADVRRQARKAYRLWAEDPFHPSFHFKCVNPEENVWAARITLGYRAVGILEGDTVTWFFAGSHDEYMRLLKTGW